MLPLKNPLFCSLNLQLVLPLRHPSFHEYSYTDFRKEALLLFLSSWPQLNELQLCKNKKKRYQVNTGHSQYENLNNKFIHLKISDLLVLLYYFFFFDQFI